MAVRRKTCIYCGEPVRTNGYCRECGLNQVFLKKAYNTSDYHYNIGLDKARVRDLSGAIDSLKMSLRYNKRNVNARNLLGLIYYELGETVMALSHWVMSANYRSRGNVAVRYLKELKDEPKKLEEANQLARMFNQALIYAGQRDFDLAYIQLRKTISLNPHFVNGYLLLALLNIEQKRTGRARKVLTKVLSIDRTNTMAIHLLKEMGETEAGIMKLRDEKSREPETGEDYYGMEQSADAGKTTVISKITGMLPFRKNKNAAETTAVNINPKISRYREVSRARFSNVYMIVGVIIGVLVLYFLVVPAKIKEVNREKEELKKTYSEQLSSQSFTIDSLTDRVSNLEGQVADYEAELSGSSAQAAEYEATIEMLRSQVETLLGMLPEGTVVEGINDPDTLAGGGTGADDGTGSDGDAGAAGDGADDGTGADGDAGAAGDDAGADGDAGAADDGANTDGGTDD